MPIVVDSGTGTDVVGVESDGSPVGGGWTSAGTVVLVVGRSVVVVVRGGWTIVGGVLMVLAVLVVVVGSAIIGVVVDVRGTNPTSSVQ